MSILKIYNEKYQNSTLISNKFIDEYMKDANDAQLKIYLYLYRMLSSNTSTSISDIADKFNHTEKDVIRALKYWEKQQLLSLVFSDDKELIGVHLTDQDSSSTNAQYIQTEPAAPSVPAKKAETKQESATSVEQRIVKPTFEKPQYSLDDIKQFKDNDEAKEILFVAETYLEKTLSATDIKTIYFFYDQLHFSSDLIDYLIQYCVEKGKKDFRYIESVAISWAEQDIKTPKQAASIAKKYDKTIYTIMKTLGKTNMPTEVEVKYIDKWTKEYCFTQDIIIEACDRTVLATDKHRLEYADTILTSWFQQGVQHKADIIKCDKQYLKKKQAMQSPNTNSNTNNKFNQFPQRNYDFQQLEKELLSR